MSIIDSDLEETIQHIRERYHSAKNEHIELERKIQLFKVYRDQSSLHMQEALEDARHAGIDVDHITN